MGYAGMEEVVEEVWRTGEYLCVCAAFAGDLTVAVVGIYAHDQCEGEHVPAWLVLAAILTGPW